MIVINNAFYGTNDVNIDIKEYIEKNLYIPKTQSLKLLYNGDICPNVVKKISVLWTKEEKGELIIREKEGCHLGFSGFIDMNFRNFFSFNVLKSRLNITDIHILYNDQIYKTDVGLWRSFFVSDNEFILPIDFSLTSLFNDQFDQQDCHIKIFYTRDTQYKTEVYEDMHGYLFKDLIIGIEPHSYKFNLIYHLYTKWSHPLINLHLHYLKKIGSLFNHKIIISIVSDDQHFQHHENHIRNELSGMKNIQFICNKNNPHINEAVSFKTLLSMIKSPDEHEYTFYAHSKGLKYNSLNQYQMIGVWSEIMYIYNVANFDTMIYHKYNMGGSFLLESPVPYGIIPSPAWHYSGSYYWIRHDQYFLDHHVSGHADYYISEKYPGLLYPSRDRCVNFFGLSDFSKITYEALVHRRLTLLRSTFSFFLKYHTEFPLSKNIIIPRITNPIRYQPIIPNRGTPGGGGNKREHDHDHFSRPTFENKSVNRFR